MSSPFDLIINMSDYRVRMDIAEYEIVLFLEKRQMHVFEGFCKLPKKRRNLIDVSKQELKFQRTEN